MSATTVESITGEEVRRAGRRRFFKQVGLAGAGAAGASLLAACGGASGLRVAQANSLAANDASSGLTDADILNFALNLEYLEAEFYTVAVTGKRIGDVGIGTDGVGTEGPTTGGGQVRFFDKEHRDVAANIARDEQEHVMFLRMALAGAAVAKPAIDLDALGLGFADNIQFLDLARAFEDVGVTAYAGAAPLLANPVYLAAAARILATEAEHSGSIRYQYIRAEVDNQDKIGKLDAVDVPPKDGIYFSVNYQGLVFTRTPAQVLAIVYGGKGKSSGAFYPNGVNGKIAGS